MVIIRHQTLEKCLRYMFNISKWTLTVRFSQHPLVPTFTGSSLLAYSNTCPELSTQEGWAALPPAALPYIIQLFLTTLILLPFLPFCPSISWSPGFMSVFPPLTKSSVQSGYVHSGPFQMLPAMLTLHLLCVSFYLP